MNQPIDGNCWIIPLIIVAALCFIVLLVWKNQKDGSKLEKDIIKADTKPARHSEHTHTEV